MTGRHLLRRLVVPPFYLQRSIKVHYTPFTAEWQISGKNVVGQNNVAAYSTYGTGRANAYKWTAIIKVESPSARKVW